MEGPCGKIKSRIKRKLGLDKKDRRLFLLTPTLAKIDEFKLIPRHGSADSSLEEVTDETRAMKDEMDRSAAGEGSESVKAKLELVRNEEKD